MTPAQKSNVNFIFELFKKLDKSLGTLTDSSEIKEVDWKVFLAAFGWK